MKYSSWILFVSSFVLFSCGGGGSSDSTPPTNNNPPPTSNPAPTVTVSGPASELEGRTVQITASSNISSNVTFDWTQTQGPTVAFNVDNNVLSFTAPDTFIIPSQSVTFSVSASANGQQSAAKSHTVVIQNDETFEDTVDETSDKFFESVERSIMYVNAVQQILEIKLSTTPDKDLCDDGPANFDYEHQIIHSDLDNDQQISAGDGILYIAPIPCESVLFDRTIEGKFEFELTSVDIENFRFEGALTVDYEDPFISYSGSVREKEEGILNFIIDKSEIGREKVITFSDTFSFWRQRTVNPPVWDIVFDINNGSISVEDDYIEAKKEITIEGIFDAVYSMNSEFSVSTEEPFTGFLGEFPSTGKMVLENEAATIDLEPLLTNSQANLKISVGDNEIEFDWIESEKIANTLFSLQPNNRPVNFRNPQEAPANPFNVAENMEFIHELSDSTLAAFVMSRPISEVRNKFNLEEEGPLKTGVINAVAVFAGTDDVVELDALVNGALVQFMIDDDEFLRPGKRYLSFFSMIDIEGNDIQIDFFEVASSPDIVPKINGTNLAYRRDDYPVLSAANSIITSANEIQYEWFEQTSYGVVFSDANAVQTSITVPEGVTEDVIIGIRISDEIGVTNEDRKTIKFVDSFENSLSIDASKEVSEGSGKHWLLANMYWEGKTVQVSEFITLESFFFESDEERQYSVDIVSPNGARLEVGDYSVQYEGPIPWLEISSLDKVCSEPITNFSVYEIEYDDVLGVTKLALDYMQNCEDPLVEGEIIPVIGKLRYNSDFRLNTTFM